jgi:hypothetical protein
MEDHKFWKQSLFAIDCLEDLLKNCNSQYLILRSSIMIFVVCYVCNYSLTIMQDEVLDCFVLQGICMHTIL